ncbi:sugar O-acetyltransferase [Lactobacillus delbrueckii]|uniref:sugar O-acetyltransferase n=1 Tax=Lactobacillus delbrueckii TaxID=1584 RepID=UPI003995E5B5
MTELEKALAGEQFDRRAVDVREFQSHVKDLCFDFNNTRPSDPKRAKIVEELVTGYNPYVFIESGFNCVFGKNIHFEGMAMINYGCTFLDSNIITIGKCALIGPGCQIICTNHALDGEERLKGLFNDKPVHIGENAWLGANVTVLPGVTIGKNAVIGAGSVVTKDIPENTIAVGNPCRVLREIEDKDKLLK